MKNVLSAVTEALNLAVECGGEIDRGIYVDARDAFEKLKLEVQSVCESVRKQGGSPTAADFEKLVELLGCRIGTEEPAVVEMAAPVAASIDEADRQNMVHRRVITLMRSQFYRQQFVIESREALDEVVLKRLMKAIDRNYPCHMMFGVGDELEFRTDIEVMEVAGFNHIIYSDGVARFTDRPNAPVLVLDAD